MNKDAKIVFIALSFLVMIGVVMIYSSSAVFAFNKYGDSLYMVKRHLVYIAVGVGAAVFFMSVSSEAIKNYSRAGLIGAILLLIAVLVPGIGNESGGARRWIRLLGTGFQPSEIAKLALIIYLADLTARKKYLMHTVRYGFIPPLFIIGLMGGLVFMEPDMGTAVSLFFIGFILLFTAGSKIKHLIIISAAMIPALCFAVLSAPYRFRRVMTFFDPWKDPSGAGFQLIQSLIALGSGGSFGVGLGASRQKLFYLPESHTDFIFSIIGEELGFLGTSFVLMLFVLLIWFSLKVAFKLKDKFRSQVVLGIAAMIAFEVIVNIGVSIGVLPTKGLPLPFISFGGSSLVCHMAAMGIFFNISREAE